MDQKEFDALVKEAMDKLRAMDLPSDILVQHAEQFVLAVKEFEDLIQRLRDQ